MNTERARNVVLTHASGHQQECLASLNHSLFGRRGANRCLYALSLRARERKRLRPRARVRTGNPRLGIDHVLPLHDRESFGQISGARH